MAGTKQRARAKAAKDVTDLLSPERMARLRKGFDEATMSALATDVLVRKYSESARIVYAIQDSLFGTGRDGNAPPLADLTDREREACLIVILASQRAKLQLAVHIYWGMMNSISPDEVAGLLMLTGVYTGLGRQTQALDVLRDTSTALDGIVAAAEEEAAKAGNAGEAAEVYAEALAVEPVLYGLLAAFS